MAQRNYADWLQGFVDFASFGEAPLKNLFWSGVSTVAGALRRRVWIDQKYFQWIPNFYIVMVAPPGIIAKSTTANLGMDLLRTLPEIKFGPDVITWQALVTSLAKATQADPDPATGELFPMSAVTFCSSELGNLLNPHDRELVDVLVDLWDGRKGVFGKETKTSGSDKVENPFVNIIGCTTPSWISGTFPEYLIGGGFTSRCVFIYAEEKRQLVPYVDENVPPEFMELRLRLIEDLDRISRLFGEFRLSEEARVYGRAWYDHHWKNPPAELNTEQFAGYVSRKQTHVHKLAMVISASKGDSLQIEKYDLETAIFVIDSIEADMPKVFAKIGQTNITRHSSIIISEVRKHPGISQQDLFTFCFRSLNYKEFLEALTGAINVGAVRSMQKGNDLSYYPTKGESDEREANQASP